jgi:hypothetical protein
MVLLVLLLYPVLPLTIELSFILSIIKLTAANNTKSEVNIYIASLLCFSLTRKSNKEIVKLDI